MACKVGPMPSAAVTPETPGPPGFMTTAPPNEGSVSGTEAGSEMMAIATHAEDELRSLPVSCTVVQSSGSRRRAHRKLV